MQILPAEPQALDRARREVFDKNIRPAGHVLDQLQAARGFEVDRDRFFVGIVNHEIVGVGARLGAAAEPAAGLAAFRVLDLDNLGTEPGKGLGAGRPGLELREVENLDAIQAVRRDAHSIHRSSLLVGSAAQHDRALRLIVETPSA